MLESQLHSALEELKSAKLIINLLQKARELMEANSDNGVSETTSKQIDNKLPAWTDVVKGVRKSDTCVKQPVWYPIQSVVNPGELQKSIVKTNGINTQRNRTLSRIKKVNSDKMVQSTKASSKLLRIEKKEFYPINEKRNKISIIGDSHARGYAANISNYLDKDFETMGTVMPGARLENIIKLNTREIKTLGKNDAVIVCGGANDIGKNESNVGLRHLKNFVAATQHTNIFIVTVPHRHDLQASSCVNQEIQVFNRKMQKMMKVNSNVSVIDVNLSRSEFTRHGMHLNASGREKMAIILGQKVKSFLVKHKEAPIMLKWEEAHDELKRTEVIIDLVNVENSELANKEVRVSKRQK
jgi:lysophospholipase L1-like esterase